MVAVPSPPEPPSGSTSPSPPFSLRVAVAADFDAYMDAFEAVAAEGRWLGAEAPVDRAARRAAFDRAVALDGAVLFVADAGDGSGIVGGSYAAVSGGVVDLGMFVVAGRRGGGVGSALIEAVIDWARAQGAYKISLAAWPTNHPAIGLYARYGFRIEGIRRRHYRRRSGALWDATFMGLVLDDETPGGPGPSTVRPSIVLPEGGIRADGPGAGGALAIRADDPGGAIVLRPWQRADIPALVALLDDPDIRRWLDRIPQPYQPADAEEFISGTRVGLTEGTQAALAIAVDGVLAGSVDLRIEGRDGAGGEVGYWVAATRRGRGVATAAVRSLCDFGFDTLGLRRIELNAAVANTASRRVAEKAGFEAEGTRRSWRSVHGVPADFVLYSRVADERRMSPRKGVVS